MVLVVGATGMVGTLVCRRLAAAGTPLRAMVRATSDPAKVAELRALGAEVVVGDVRDRTSLAGACRDMASVITTVSSMPFGYIPGENDIETTDRAGSLALLAEASAAGVGHIVYTSFSANLDRPFPLREAKRDVERAIIGSGLDYTILRPSCFMQVWLSPAVGFDALGGTVTVYGEGTSPVSWIAIQDVAAFAVASLTAPTARNAVLELGGPRPVPPVEVVRIMEQALGRTLAVSHVPVEALDQQIAAANDPMAKSFASLMRCVADGDAIEMGRTADLVPAPMMSVEGYARSLAATAGAAIG